jgi:hypothetical protein
VTFIQFSIFRLVENLFRGPKFHDILDQIDNSEYISNCTILNLKQSDNAKARTNLISKIPTSETSCCGSVIITSSTSGNCLMWTMITLDLIVDNYVWIMYSINFKRNIGVSCYLYIYCNNVMLFFSLYFPFVIIKNKKPSNVVHMTCYWNNLHYVRTISKDWKANEY